MEVKRAVASHLEARSKLQRSVIDRHRLVSPYDGVISRCLADAGEWVQTGTPVADLVALDNPRLDVQVPQEYFAALGGESGVTVRIDAFPGREFKGRVAATVPVKDPVARTFLTRIEWDDAGVNAGPGMSGRAVFEIRSDKRVVQVPRDAVVRFPDGSARIWTLGEKDGRVVAASKGVVPGESLADIIQVTSGLDAGARVIVWGNEGLEEGQPVKVLSTDSEAGKQ